MEKIAQMLRRNDDIALIAHVFPDGDAAGATFGLALALKNLGKKVRVFCDDPIPPNYGMLLAYGEVLNALPQDPDWPPCVVALDCADIKRAGRSAELLEHARESANIDHHSTNPANFAQLNFVDGNASSTSEIVYRLLRFMNEPIKEDIATCLYSGIAFDTGGFSHSNTTSDALRAAADLVDKGADPHYIATMLYKNVPLSNLLLTARAVSKVELYFKDRVALTVVSLDDLIQFDARPSDCENIVESLKDINTVEIAVLLREMQSGKYKCSLRSKFYADVASVAGKFGGGGHKMASGCLIFGNESSAKGQILSELANILKG